jgi:nucleotide-binding universal stress UspA family protein
MTYASVLVHVQTGPDGAATLHCARAIADEFEATLIGIGAQAVPPPPFSDPLGTLAGDWVSAMRDTVEDNLKQAQRAFRAASANLSKPAIWECGMQLPGPAVARAARGADLVVIGLPQKERDDPFTTVRPGDLALEAGRPVLVAPHGCPPLDAKHILVAWKDTRESRRAMADAIPLLQRAEDVLVVEVCGHDEERDAKIRTGDVAAALVRHGVNAKAKVVMHDPAGAHEILHQASLIGADLIVAGAYGHSRLGEWMFGGVTRDLLAYTDRYLLLSH